MIGPGRRLLAGALLAACVLPVLGASPVEELLARQAAAWNAGDLDGFCALYEDDAVFVAPSGLKEDRRALAAWSLPSR